MNSISRKSFVVMAVAAAVFAGQLYFTGQKATAHASETVVKASFSCQKYAQKGYGDLMCP